MVRNITFTARVITGSGRGKALGTPTLNLDLFSVPEALREGVYAVFAIAGGAQHAATMHFGPRPTLNLQKSCEVHLLDATVQDIDHISVLVVERLRDVQHFQSEEALKKQIAKDSKQARILLCSDK